jgi:hypothetical protein
MDDVEKYKEIQTKRKALYNIIDELRYKNSLTTKEEVIQYRKRIEELSPTITDTLMLLAMLDEWIKLKENSNHYHNQDKK